MYKLTLKGNEEPEELLEKALKGLKNIEASKPLRDPYLRLLQGEMNHIRDVVLEAMINELVDLLSGEEAIKKSDEVNRFRVIKGDLNKSRRLDRSKCVYVERWVNDPRKKGGGYNRKQWVSLEHGIKVTYERLSKIGIANPKKAKFIDKKTGETKKVSEIAVFARDNQIKTPLANYILENYNLSKLATEIKDVDKNRNNGYDIIFNRAISYEKGESDKAAVIRWIEEGAINKEAFYEYKKQFDKQFERAIKTPVGVVTNQRDVLWHIARRGHTELFNVAIARKAANLLKKPKEIYKTTDKFKNESFVFTDNKSKSVIVVVRKGTIRSIYVPNPKYLKERIKTGERVYPNEE